MSITHLDNNQPQMKKIKPSLGYQHLVTVQLSTKYGYMYVNHAGLLVHGSITHLQQPYITLNTEV